MSKILEKPTDKELRQNLKIANIFIYCWTVFILGSLLSFVITDDIIYILAIFLAVIFETQTLLLVHSTKIRLEIRELKKLKNGK